MTTLSRGHGMYIFPSLFSILLAIGGCVLLGYAMTAPAHTTLMLVGFGLAALFLGILFGLATSYDRMRERLGNRHWFVATLRILLIIEAVAFAASFIAGMAGVVHAATAITGMRLL